MRAMDMTGRWRRAVLAAGSVGLAIASAGCGVTREATSAPAQAMSAAAGQSGLPIVVSCEPTQRTIVRPTIVNGAAMSQVECVAGESQAVASAAPAALAGEIRTRGGAHARRAAGVSGYRRHGGRAGRRRAPLVRRPVRARQVVYDERRAPRRSVKKSAVIIGSSAGVGAGVGAAIGGKKGALLGAVVGGGGATALGPDDASKELTARVRRGSGSGAFLTATHCCAAQTVRKSASCAGRRPAEFSPAQRPNSLDFRPHACPGAHRSRSAEYFVTSN